jgi:hypothetical protein
MDQEYRDLSQWFPGAQIIPGWAPVKPFNDIVRDIGFNRSINVSNVPLLQYFAEEDGELRLGSNVGWDDYARMNKAASEKDYGQVSKSLGTGLLEVALLGLGGGLGKLVGKGISKAFGSSATSGAKAAAPGSRYTQPITTLPGSRPAVGPAAGQAASGAPKPSVWSSIRNPANREAVTGSSVNPWLRRWLPGTGLTRGQRVNPLYNPRKGRMTGGRLVIGAAIGSSIVSGIARIFQGDAPPESMGLDPAYVQQLMSRTGGDPTLAAQELINRQYEDFIKLGTEQFTGPDDYNERSRQRMAQYLASMMNYGDARSPALQAAFNRVAGELGSVGAGGIMSAEAAGIADMYGRQAGSTMREGRDPSGPAGDSPTAGLTPVDASLAETAEAMRGEGASLADWLGEYGSITDRLLSERAAAAGERGGAEARYLQDQIAMQMMSAENRLERELLDREDARQNALMEFILGVRGEQTRALTDLQAARLQADMARQQSVDVESIMSAQNQWAMMPDEEKARWAQFGIVDVESFINYVVLGQTPVGPVAGG